MYSQSYACGYTTKQSSDTVRKKLSVPSGYSLTDTYVANLFSSGVDGYAFYGLVDAVSSDDTYVPSTSLTLSYSYGDEITENSHFYAIFTKTSTSESTITTAVNNTTSGNTTNIYIGAHGEGCNVSTDPTYVSSINNVALGTSDTPATVADGAIVNFCLNSSATQAYASYSETPYDATNNPTGYYLKVEPQEENRQYTVSLQNDLYVNGTLVIGGTYGSGTCSGTQGNINSYYVVLDLNGHDIHVSNTGSIMCYGMIIDSSLVPGTIYLKGGNITTLLVMLDYKDFYTTFGCAMTYVCPFQLYFIPYLRCRVEFTYDATYGWGEIDSFCRVHAATNLTVFSWTVDGLATDLTLNLIGPSDDTNKAFIFELETPASGEEEKASVVYEYNSLDGVLTDEDATTEDLQNINDYSLFVRNGLAFNNVEFTMGDVDITFSLIGSAKITVGYANDFSFPISPFFDIALNGSTFNIDSQLQFEAGSTFTADSDSKVILTTATYLGGPYQGSVRFGGISSLDRGINYYDKKSGNFVEDNALNELTMDGKQVTGFDATSFSIADTMEVKETFTTTVDDTVWGNATLWKYLGGASVTIRGQLLLDASKGATDASIKNSGRCYKLSGEIDFNEDNVGLITAKMGTLLYGDVVSGTYDSAFASMGVQSSVLSLIKALDPFSAIAYGAWGLAAQASSYSDALYMQTYGYDFIPGQYPGTLESDNYYTSYTYFFIFAVYYTELNERGFARPLVSNGKAYVVDTIADTSNAYNYGVPTISYEGTYDFDTGIFTSSVKNTLTYLSLSSAEESKTYYFDVYDSGMQYDSSNNNYDSSFEKQTPTDTYTYSSSSGSTTTYYMPDYGLAITECTVSSENDGIGPYITSTASGTESKYRYFAGIYVKDSSYITYETYVLKNAGTLIAGTTYGSYYQTNFIDPMLNSLHSNLTTEMTKLGLTYAVSYLGKLFTLAGCSSIAIHYDSTCTAYKYDETYTNANFTIQLNFANLMTLMP